MFLILIVIIIVLLLLYVKLKYFTLRGSIPGIPPQFLFGNLVQTGLTKGETYANIYTALRKRFGDVFQIWLGYLRFIVVADVEDIQHIFTNRHIYEQGKLFTDQLGSLVPTSIITTTGPAFKRHGAVTLALFRRNKITPNFDLIIDCVDKLLDKWRTNPKDHIHTDIIVQSQNLLLQIFGYIAFDFDLGALDERNSTKGRNELNQALDDFLSAVNIVFFTPTFVSKTYLTFSSRYHRARATIDKYIHRMIEQELSETEESRSQRKRTSLIASLVDSLQQEEQSEELKRGLSRTEILDNMIAFLVAGFETTSTALSWFIYAMSKNPRVQQKIKAELRDENGQCDLSLERLESLVYLDCVINETLRYYPPAAGVTRVVMSDDRLPKTGIQLQKGEDIIIPIAALARDPRLWITDPELYYPERFLNEDKNHTNLALSPFGGGHRQCIGQDLARFELKLIAARLMQYMTFGDGGPEVNAGGYDNGLTVKPKAVGVTIHFDS